MSSQKVRRAVITCNDIIAAYEQHGDNFIVVDIDNKRDFKSYCNYININMMKADGEIISPIYCKMDISGIKTSSNIREPAVRQYEQIRIALRQYNELEEETINMKAMRILCSSYKNIIKKMVDDGIITHHKDVPRKKNGDGCIRPVLLISTDPKTPMQNTVVNRQTQEVEAIDNPIFWINIPKKNYKKNTAPPPKQFGDMCYKEDDGSDGKPFMVYDFDVSFYDIENQSFDPITGKKRYGLVGEMDEDGNTELNNTNIHKFITKNTILFGSFKFGMTVSSRGAKLDISLCGANHIKQGEDDVVETNTEEELTDFESALGLTQSKDTIKKESIPQKKEFEEDDSDIEFDT